MDDAVDGTDSVNHVIELLKWLKKGSNIQVYSFTNGIYLQYLQEALV